MIPLLEHDGYTVIAVQNLLASADGDIANTKRVIDDQKGPVVVVAHSYGGLVMTGAAANNPNVKALVYIAAYGPEVNETIGGLSAKYPTTPLGKALVPDAAGFLYIDRAQFHTVFYPDVPQAEADVMNVVQVPLAAAIFTQTVSAAAWKTVPSWYMVSQDDKAINPDQERFYAKRMKAKTVEVKSSHVSLVSHPAEVAKMIEEAAHSTM